MSKLKEIQEEYRERGIVSIALFGSYASGTQNIYSDIDIAIKKEKDFLAERSPYTYFETLNALKDQIIRKLHRNVDIFDLDSNSKFKEEIEKELIYV
ncbi:nucleotidyltransferase family protein [Nitratifractor sp.]